MSQMQANGASVRQLATTNALSVNIVDATGAQIASFGGGTQYVDGATDATPTGTVAMWKNAADEIDAVSAANPLPVNIVAGSSSGVQYTEDDAAAANPVGTAVNLIRQDTPAGLTTTDGDNLAQRGTNYGAAFVQIVSSAGSFVDTFGGGTQYTEGDTDATPTGTVAMWKNAGDVIDAVSATNPLPVGDAGASLTVDAVGLDIRSLIFATDKVDITGSFVDVGDNGGSLTVDNATLSTIGGGTEADALRVTIANDSTGVLSIDDNGGSITVDGTITEANSSAIAASLSVLDDWDESDRAKANIIVGQAGVAAGSGTNGATVQRVTIATDDAVSTGIASKYITGIGHGVTTVTTAGTDVALAGSTACKRVFIQAQTDNTSGIAVGATGVDATIATGTGFFLNPGDGLDFDIDNLADIFIDSLVSGEGVRYTYFT